MKKLKLINTSMILIGLLFNFHLALSQDEIKIGHQTWAAKNLEVVTFRNGDTIAEANGGKKWKDTATKKTPAWCYYNNDPKNGKLYNWYAITDPRGLAQDGWHVPSLDEWKELGNALGGLKEAAEKLKSSTEWNGNNSSGFNALPCGIRYGTGPYGGASFDNLGSIGYFWCTTEGNIIYLKTNKNSLFIMKTVKHGGEAYFSVRCIKG